MKETKATPPPRPAPQTLVMLPSANSQNLTPQAWHPMLGDSTWNPSNLTHPPCILKQLGGLLLGMVFYNCAKKCLVCLLLSSKGIVLVISSKHVSIFDSNEAKVLAILEALRIFVPYFHQKISEEWFEDCDFLRFFMCGISLEVSMLFKESGRLLWF